LIRQEISSCILPPMPGVFPDYPAPPRAGGYPVTNIRNTSSPQAAILATWQGQTRPIIVDVDTVVGGEQQTYSFMRVLTKGAAHVRRVMN
jgi:hypothetical protein